ncbi:MAG: hypothetical protein ACREJM_04880 [Candidatus Saccharimonadales bacterium]
MSAAQEQLDTPGPNPGEQAPPAQPLSWAEHRAVANEAWDEALARDVANQPETAEEGEVPPLDEETAGLYDRVRRHFKAAIFAKPDTETQDPIDLMKLGGSQARLAEVTPVGLVSDGGRLFDLKSALQEGARTNLQKAAAMLMGEDVEVSEALVGQMPDVDPSEVVVEAVVGAAKEAGTDEHVWVRDEGDAGSETQRLEAQGVEGVERFIRVHGEVPGQGDEFMRVVAQRVVEQLTGEHALPDESAADKHDLAAAA